MPYFAPAAPAEWTVLVDEDVSGLESNNIDTDLTFPLTGNWDRLRIRVFVPQNAASTGIVLRFNGDSGNNYRSTRVLANDSAGTVTATNQTGVAYMRVYAVNGTAHDIEVEVSNKTSSYKFVRGLATGYASPNLFTNSTYGVWLSTNRVTSVAVSPNGTAASGTTFPTGSRFVVEGSNA